MRSAERQRLQPALPGAQAAASWLARIRQITGAAATAADLTTVLAEDLLTAYRELVS